MSHTPGPWKVEVDQPNLAHVIGCELIVAHCWSDDYWCDLSETDLANARLIAAAPEMLEALKALLRHLNEYCDEHDGHYAVPPEIQLYVDAIIAKAEGRQP